MGYTLPVGDVFVSSGYDDHANRNPPSSEPGTDYACGYGTVVVAVDDLIVRNVQTHPGGGTGRFVECGLSDGRSARTLHMSEVWVGVGQQVTRGTPVGLSGASGYGDDWYYGPHAHQTLFDGGVFASPTLNFELYVGPKPGPGTGTGDEEMTRLLVTHAGNDGDPRNGISIVNAAQARLISPEELDFLNGWQTSSGKSLAQLHEGFVTGGNPRAYDLVVDLFGPGKPGHADD